jgi:hypothetical protein
MANRVLFHSKFNCFSKKLGNLKFGRGMDIGQSFTIKLILENLGCIEDGT